MTVVGLTADGKKIVYTSASGPSNYSQANNFNLTVGDVNRIDTVLFLHIDGGYKIIDYSVSGNVINIVIGYYDFSKSSADVASEVADGADLSSITITAVVIGT